MLILRELWPKNDFFIVITKKILLWPNKRFFAIDRNITSFSLNDWHFWKKTKSNKCSLTRMLIFSEIWAKNDSSKLWTKNDIFKVIWPNNGCEFQNDLKKTKFPKWSQNNVIFFEMLIFLDDFFKLIWTKNVFFKII